MMQEGVDLVEATPIILRVSVTILQYIYRSDLLSMIDLSLFAMSINHVLIHPPQV